MNKERDPFKKFQESLEGLEGNLHILDTHVPVEEQMEFFRYSEILKDEYDENSIDEQIERLNFKTTSLLDLKHALSLLSVSGDIKAYRAIENYNRFPDPRVKNWAVLALLQGKITLESQFSDEKQIFISTGLGGRDEKLRFFAFFKANNLIPFSDYQKELIEKEMSYSIHKQDGEIELFEIKDIYFSLVFLVNIHLDIKNLLEEATVECNQYGNFINKSFIITNVRVFNRQNIQNELLGYQNELLTYNEK